jgi:hypothetical protein
MPMSVTMPIAFAAQQRARTYMTMRQWRSVGNVFPVFGVGYVGLKTDKSFLMYQEKGTQPFLMKSLEGKTIPMRGEDGQLHFVKVKDVGKPGWVTMPSGQKFWRAEKWKHPGIAATNFMATSIAYGILDNRGAIRSLMNTILGIPGGVQPW